MVRPGRDRRAMYPSPPGAAVLARASLVPEAGGSAGLRRAGMGMRVASRRLEAVLAGMVRGPGAFLNPVDVFSRGV